MISTTPAPERYTRFSCPNPQCARFNRPGEVNIAHRSWTGTHKHIERLRCTACDREFSEREGTLMARSKLPKDTVIRLVKCQRWGVCDAGTADICAVELKTVHRFQHVAAQHAETHHRQVVCEVDVPGIQLDEAHSKLRPRQVAWLHTALAMGSWFLLWIDVGPRTQEQVAALVAQVVARMRALPIFLTDGWKASSAALLQVVGIVYRRRRRGKVGRKPKPRLVAPKQLFYAQVVKVRNPAGRVVEVSRWVVFGWSSPLCAAVMLATTRHDDPDGLYGTLVWHAAGAGRPPAAPHSLSVLEPSPPPGTTLAYGQPLQFRDVP